MENHVEQEGVDGRLLSRHVIRKLLRREHTSQRQPSDVFYKKRLFLKILHLFTRKHQCWDLFFKKLQAFRFAYLSKKTPKQVFSCEYCKNLRTTILKKIWKWLLLTRLVATYPFILQSFAEWLNKNQGYQHALISTAISVTLNPQEQLE